MLNSTRLCAISTTMMTVINASKAPRLTTLAAQPTPTAASALETGALPPS